jgi:hypothetical protein
MKTRDNYCLCILLYLFMVATVADWVAASAEGQIQSRGLRWIAVSPVRQVNGEGLLAEIRSRVASDEGMERDTGSTQGHELSHFLAARIRNENGFNPPAKAFRAFYMYGGHAAIIEGPPVTIQDVMRATPPEYRGYAFKSYTDAETLAAWNDRPLYLVEEMTAYINGCVAGMETGTGQPEHHYRMATELHKLSLVICSVAKRKGGYDYGPLCDFLDLSRDYMLTLQPYVYGKQVKQVICGPNGCSSGGGSSGGGSFGGSGFGRQDQTRRVYVPMVPGRQPSLQPRQPVRNTLRRLLPKFPRRPLMVQPNPPPVLPGPGPSDDPPLVPIPDSQIDHDNNLAKINKRLDELEKAIAERPAGAECEVTLKMFNSLTTSVEALTVYGRDEVAKTEKALGELREHEHAGAGKPGEFSEAALDALVDKVLAKLPPFPVRRVYMKRVGTPDPMVPVPEDDDRWVSYREDVDEVSLIDGEGLTIRTFPAAPAETAEGQQ